jgi:hypothetical protein
VFVAGEFFLFFDFFFVRCHVAKLPLPKLGVSKLSSGGALVQPVKNASIKVAELTEAVMPEVQTLAVEARKIVDPVPGVAGERLHKALVDLANKVEFQARDDIERGRLSTETLENVLVLEALASRLSGVSSKLTKLVERFTLGGGSYVAGPYMVVVGSKEGKKSPKWKEEAIAKARRVAQLTNKTFDEKGYVNTVLAKTNPGKTTIVEVVERRVKMAS